MFNRLGFILFLGVTRELAKCFYDMKATCGMMFVLRSKGVLAVLLVLCVLFSAGGSAFPVFCVGDTISVADVPACFDWRDVDGVDYTSSVKNQVPAPTCEAYGLVAALETIVHYQVGEPFGCDLSEAHLFFYAGGGVEWGGVPLEWAAEYLVEYGVPDEGCFPDPHRPYDAAFESVAGWENRTVNISDWGWVPLEETAMKQALIEYGPLVVCVYTRMDFLRYRRGIYMPEGEIVWGHVVTLVGYDDDQRCWIIKNSAGPRWGEQGYIRVSYDAHSEEHPFFADFYGGEGVMYVDGVAGNFRPEVPVVTIEKPDFHHTYVFGLELPSFIRNVSGVQLGAARVIGKLPVKVAACDTLSVEFYLDGERVFTDVSEPFEIEVRAKRGLHTLEVVASDDHTISKDIVDFYVIV